MTDKIRMTFDVDKDLFFSALALMNGNCAAIGVRLSSVMLTGQATFLESVGLAAYGITLVDVQATPVVEE